jgi:hypothetical protein
VLRDVDVQYDECSGALSILSDAAGVVGEDLTLAVVGAEGDLELCVQVVTSRPQIISGVLRHRLELRRLGCEAFRVHSNGDRSRES